MLFPLKQPYRITSPYGQRWGKLHNGIDIAVPVKTEIYAPLRGEVSAVYSNSVGGNQMIIKHPNGITTGYSHLTKALKKVGDQVIGGEIIALSGNTGRSTGPHLHFTTRKDGVRVDPQIFKYTPVTDQGIKIRKFTPKVAILVGSSIIALSIGIYYYQKNR